MSIFVDGGVTCNLNGKLTVNVIDLIPSLPPELKILFEHLRVKVYPPDTAPYVIAPLNDEQSNLLEVEVNPGDWCHEMAQVGMSDRGLPYDKRGHGEVTFRVWYGTSPNKESYLGEMYFVEVWLGGAYPKTLELLQAEGWVEIAKYGVGGQWAWYFEVHPDWHIM